MKAIVDSSVIVKWLNATDEEDVDAANRLLADALDRKVELFILEDAAFLSLAKQYNARLVTNNVKHQGRAQEINVVALKDYK